MLWNQLSITCYNGRRLKSVIKKPGKHNHLPPDEKNQQENFRKTVFQSVEQNVSRSLKKSYDEAGYMSVFRQPRIHTGQYLDK